MSDLTKSELAKYSGRTAEVTFTGTVRSDGAIVLNEWGDWVLYDPGAAGSITLLPESDFTEDEKQTLRVFGFDPDASFPPKSYLRAVVEQMKHSRSTAGDLMDLHTRMDERALSKAEGDFLAAVSLPPPND